MIDDFRPVERSAKSLPAAPSAFATEAPKTQTADFRTPEEIAAAEASASTPPDKSSPGPEAASWRQKLALSWPPGKKEAIVAAIVLLAICGSGAALLLRHHPSKAAVHAVIKPKPKLPPKPTTVPSTLSGLPVDPGVNTRPVTGVMIENSQDARPQSGLGQASIVFEAIAEGGITRFLALYQDTAPESIGPIRSARPYYVQWALGFDAGYAHVGGSPEALADIRAWGVRDLDQFANGGSYHRISQRAAPHNVYTGMSNLNQLETTKGYTASAFTSFPRKTAGPSKTPNAKSVDLKLSGPLYNAHYDYIAATNSYNRSEGGAPHIEANTNTVISPAVVIALVIPYGLQSDGHHSEYQTIGSGTAYVFQDGMLTMGTWTKTTEKLQLALTDAAGKPLLLNPGQTWLTAVSGAGSVSAAP